MARQALADVEARHHDILKLEKSIIELNEMFIDISEMIENQVKLNLNPNRLFNEQRILKILNNKNIRGKWWTTSSQTSSKSRLTLKRPK